MQALDRALALEPRHPPALLQKGLLTEQRGDWRGSGAHLSRRAGYRGAGDAVRRRPCARRSSMRATWCGRMKPRSRDAIEERVAAVRTRHGPEAARRADWCLEHSDRPASPLRLAADLPVLSRHSGTRVLRQRRIPPGSARSKRRPARFAPNSPPCSPRTAAELQPYVAYPDGVPLDQWKELNQSRRWSAYFLWNEGALHAEHLARCPRTAQLLRSAPQCDVAQHGPNAFFSILEPRTRIPPHTGVTNARLTVHVPLIVPPRLRVSRRQRDTRVGPGTRLGV